MSSIYVATRGLISNYLPIGIATDGLIRIIIVSAPSGSSIGGGFAIQPDYEHQEKFLLQEQLHREDVELLEIIATISPYL